MPYLNLRQAVREALKLPDEIPLRDAFPNKYYPEDYLYWLRNEAGDRVEGWPGAFLLDFTHPGQQDIIVQQALAIAQCGLYDGIFLDWWDEDNHVIGNDLVDSYRGNEVEQRARDTIIDRIRASVGDDFLIIVNTNRRKIPRTGWAINGTFMETGRDHDRGYTHDGLAEIESTLLWAEENLREPRINCLEGWGVPTESPDSPRNLRNTIHTIPDLDGEIYLKRTTDRHDVNEDGIVNILDLVAVANGFGKNSPDVNADGVVNVLDLVAVANAFE